VGIVVVDAGGNNVPVAVVVNVSESCWVSVLWSWSMAVMRLEVVGMALLFPDHHVASTLKEDLRSLVELSLVWVVSLLLMRAIFSILFDTDFGGKAELTSMCKSGLKSFGDSHGNDEWPSNDMSESVLCSNPTSRPMFTSEMATAGSSVQTSAAPLAMKVTAGVVFCESFESGMEELLVFRIMLSKDWEALSGISFRAPA
jgi:hypothetical protein